MFKKIVVSNNQKYRQMSDFITQYNQNHIPTTPLQKILLSVGSATVSMFDPQRAGNIRNLIPENAKKYHCSLFLMIVNNKLYTFFFK